MQCMKCGRDLDDGQVFCNICREDMDNYPVKPGTVVLLPNYVRYSQPKRIPKRILTHEEQIRKLKKRNRIMAYLFALALAIAVSFGMLALYLYAEYEEKFLPGQNYTAVESQKKGTLTSDGSAE